MKTSLGFSDLALIFKVTVELNQPILSVCGCGGGGDTCFSSPEPKVKMGHLLKL